MPEYRRFILAITPNRISGAAKHRESDSSGSDTDYFGTKRVTASSESGDYLILPTKVAFEDALLLLYRDAPGVG